MRAPLTTIETQFLQDCISEINSLYLGDEETGKLKLFGRTYSERLIKKVQVKLVKPKYYKKP